MGLIGVVLGDLLAQLKEEGYVLNGRGDPVVVHDGRLLDRGQTLPAQRVNPNEVLRVHAVLHGGAVQATPQPVPPPMPPPPPSYMTQAILVTLFCCVPLGIVAIFKARAVHRAVALGDMRKALSASSSAKKLVIASFVVGLLILIGVIGNLSSNGS